MSSAYALANSYRLSDSRFDNPLVMDGIDWQYIGWDALARSGEYFSHLANVIDEISLKLSIRSREESEELESIVEQLLYMQAAYEVTKKD